jgi:hypothetical protein
MIRGLKVMLQAKAEAKAEEENTNSTANSNQKEFLCQVFATPDKIIPSF